MTLRLEFMVEPRSSRYTNELVHFGVSDGCFSDLEELSEQTTEGLPNGELTHLFYANLWITEILGFRDEAMRLHCPTCKKDYTIKWEDYLKERDAFIDNNILKKHKI